MQYASGGELYEFVSERKVLNDNEARKLFRQISSAVFYCHQSRICHRDLKLENILLDEKGSAKIADFGLSNVFSTDGRRFLTTFCGSPLYASPEIVRGIPYAGPEVDCWSLGVLLYTLVYGAMPFDGSNFRRLVKQISESNYYEPSEVDKRSSASDLIKKLLTVDPLKRATIVDICNDPWVNAGYDNSLIQLSQDLAKLTPVRLDMLQFMFNQDQNENISVDDNQDLSLASGTSSVRSSVPTSRVSTPKNPSATPSSKRPPETTPSNSSVTNRPASVKKKKRTSSVSKKDPNVTVNATPQEPMDVTKGQSAAPTPPKPSSTSSPDHPTSLKQESSKTPSSDGKLVHDSSPSTPTLMKEPSDEQQNRLSQVTRKGSVKSSSSAVTGASPRVASAPAKKSSGGHELLTDSLEARKSSSSATPKTAPESSEASGSSSSKSTAALRDSSSSLPSSAPTESGSSNKTSDDKQIQQHPQQSFNPSSSSSPIVALNSISTPQPQHLLQHQHSTTKESSPSQMSSSSPSSLAPSNMTRPVAEVKPKQRMITSSPSTESPPGTTQSNPIHATPSLGSSSGSTGAPVSTSSSKTRLERNESIESRTFTAKKVPQVPNSSLAPSTGTNDNDSSKAPSETKTKSNAIKSESAEGLKEPKSTVGIPTADSTSSPVVRKGSVNARITASNSSKRVDILPKSGSSSADHQSVAESSKPSSTGTKGSTTDPCRSLDKKSSPKITSSTLDSARVVKDLPKIESSSTASPADDIKRSELMNINNSSLNLTPNTSSVPAVSTPLASGVPSNKNSGSTPPDGSSPSSGAVFSTKITSSSSSQMLMARETPSSSCSDMASKTRMMSSKLQHQKSSESKEVNSATSTKDQFKDEGSSYSASSSVTPPAVAAKSGLTHKNLMNMRTKGSSLEQDQQSVEPASQVTGNQNNSRIQVTDDDYEPGSSSNCLSDPDPDLQMMMMRRRMMIAFNSTDGASKLPQTVNSELGSKIRTRSLDIESSSGIASMATASGNSSNTSIFSASGSPTVKSKANPLMNPIDKPKRVGRLSIPNFLELQEKSPPMKKPIPSYGSIQDAKKKLLERKDSLTVSIDLSEKEHIFPTIPVAEVKQDVERRSSVPEPPSLTKGPSGLRFDSVKEDDPVIMRTGVRRVYNRRSTEPLGLKFRTSSLPPPEERNPNSESQDEEETSRIEDNNENNNNERINETTQESTNQSSSTACKLAQKRREKFSRSSERRKSSIAELNPKMPETVSESPELRDDNTSINEDISRLSLKSDQPSSPSTATTAKSSPKHRPAPLDLNHHEEDPSRLRLMEMMSSPDDSSIIQDDDMSMSQSSNMQISKIKPAPITRSYKKFSFTSDGARIVESRKIYSNVDEDGKITRIEKIYKVTHHSSKPNSNGHNNNNNYSSFDSDLVSNNRNNDDNGIPSEWTEEEEDERILHSGDDQNADSDDNNSLSSGRSSSFVTRGFSQMNDRNRGHPPPARRHKSVKGTKDSMRHPEPPSASTSRHNSVKMRHPHPQQPSMESSNRGRSRKTKGYSQDYSPQQSDLFAPNPNSMFSNFPMFKSIFNQEQPNQQPSMFDNDLFASQHPRTSSFNRRKNSKTGLQKSESVSSTESTDIFDDIFDTWSGDGPTGFGFATSGQSSAFQPLFGHSSGFGSSSGMTSSLNPTGSFSRMSNMMAGMKSPSLFHPRHNLGGPFSGGQTPGSSGYHPLSATSSATNNSIYDNQQPMLNSLQSFISGGGQPASISTAPIHTSMNPQSMFQPTSSPYHSNPLSTTGSASLLRRRSSSSSSNDSSGLLTRDNSSHHNNIPLYGRRASSISRAESMERKTNSVLFPDSDSVRLNRLGSWDSQESPVLSDVRMPEPSSLLKQLQTRGYKNMVNSKYPMWATFSHPLPPKGPSMASSGAKSPSPPLETSSLPPTIPVCTPRQSSVSQSSFNHNPHLHTHHTSSLLNTTSGSSGCPPTGQNNGSNPERESVRERIHRKSFYSRFNDNIQ